MRQLFSFRGETGALAYAVFAPALLLSQHLVVLLLYRSAGVPLRTDASFWLLPLRRLSFLPDLSPATAALAFAFSLAIAWALALLSFRRAARSRLGYGFAAFAIVPAFQIAAIALLAAMPVGRSVPAELSDREVEAQAAAEAETGFDTAHILQGLLAGVAIIVVAVLLSALTFGAYGWGLFVMTPFLVGLTTAYLANRRVALSSGETLTLVLSAGGLGTLALLMLALEGFMCILLVAPLAALVAAAGGAIGRAAALARNAHDRPLMSLAVLPALFALEAAMPPAMPIDARNTIDIAAPPAAVWDALTSADPIGLPPGLVGRAGLAFPIRSRLDGRGVGGERLGIFSTGIARERITAWAPARTLAFEVLSQPPAMEEMSPWRRVHAPHVSGYFDTAETRFDLVPLPGGGTRLTARAAHVLRIDPVLYWEPIARWAIGRNVDRVLADIKAKAEAGGRR